MQLKSLEYYSPDTVAECFEGVSSDLYAHLWNIVVPSYEADCLKLPQDSDSKFYRSLEPNSIGWLKYVGAEFRSDLEKVMTLNINK